jgi:ADP-ribosylglycohydrolase
MLRTDRQTDSGLRGRIRAMLHGLAFGDALGAPVERLTAAEIRARYGRVRSLDTPWHKADWPPHKRGGRIRGGGIVTDDTLMTLCLMRVYGEVGRHLDAWDMAGPMVRAIAWDTVWVPELQRETVLIDRLYYPEKWIFQRHQLAGCDPRQGGIGNMVNCGAAMYAAPIGAANAADPQAAYAEAIAFMSGHQESFGLEAAGVMAAAVAAAFAPGATIDRVVDAALSVARDGTRAAIADIAGAAVALRGRPHDAVVTEFHRILIPRSPAGDDMVQGPALAGRATDAYRPSRWGAIEELPIALGFALLHRGEFAPSIEDGVNSGRDIDSIGGMTGAILGALHGEAVVDPAVARTLDTANRLDLRAEADRFTDTVAAIHAADARHRNAVAEARAALVHPARAR